MRKIQKCTCDMIMKMIDKAQEIHGGEKIEVLARDFNEISMACAHWNGKQIKIANPRSINWEDDDFLSDNIDENEMDNVYLIIAAHEIGHCITNRTVKASDDIHGRQYTQWHEVVAWEWADMLLFTVDFRNWDLYKQVKTQAEKTYRIPRKGSLQGGPEQSDALSVLIQILQGL